MSSDWRPKRFWTAASVSEVDGGFAVLLDDRPVKTPAKSTLVVPSRAMAEAIATEWMAQEKVVDPETMPVTRSANAALDKVRPQHADVAELLAAYGETDLICYRATTPVELAARQAEYWDPLIDWSATWLPARLNVASGVMHVAQDPATVTAMHQRTAAIDSFSLAAFHDLVGISGSLIIPFALTQGFLNCDAAWRASRVDEDWQTEQWGDDDEATKAAAHKREAFFVAARIWGLLNTSQMRDIRL